MESYVEVITADFKVKDQTPGLLNAKKESHFVNID